ncbi:peptidase T [Schleiferilactobacillus perolens]|jgi:tripeptide aminopeptidase|uniref:peptidase T n=1 Tax=Schleiferilactobacillus perolens TaxID=100468 RepID=UPI0023568C76|nr:peptidase T [Schleiferilactobacillus perolens]MCI1891735.1 peptidase T [Schleiferilactobacillus harbinensis]MCI1912081.1 peptidase T [Schleiferilactobacillus harbinensis]MCI2172091.1 peptidase T [Schleiferilactobacillus perolens]
MTTTKYPTLIPRFLRYVKINTRSDENSTTIPSSEREVKFLQQLVTELREIGLTDAVYHDDNGYVTATIPSNIDRTVPTIGFLAHVDTADFNAEGVNPQIVKNYDGHSVIPLDKKGEYTLDPKDFPALKKYQGHTLITTDGSTLLGSDDKSGVAEIFSLVEYLLAHPEIEHGDIRIGFGPDEEIGTGADHFNVPRFNADFAYTVDGGPLGQLEYETFSAAALHVDIKGKNVHPSTAYHTMINAIQLGIDYQNALPQNEVPEETKDREGFFHLLSFNGTPDHAELDYIIRDFERSGLTARKEKAQAIADQLNSQLDEPRVTVEMHDQYYNMIDVMKDHMDVVKLAEQAMHNLDITPDETPVRGGTDGSKISFMGLPTPNLFAGGENMHGRFEFVSEQTMAQAVDVLVEIVKLNAADH